MQRRLLIGTYLICISLYVSAQQPAYPKNYFRNPLDIPIKLTANFGELREGHWHMGLDIRTAQKENLPVYAAAGGYIAHIGIRPQSFGRFIIINHPNGFSTLYAHLNDFYPALEEYVTAKQYNKESWAIELDFTSNQFPVSKGSFIAFSGNTGGSQGPHLHFEIFDTKTEKRFNPLLFNFPLEDNVDPTLIRLAMYDRSKSIYNNTPVFYAVKKTDSGYILPKIPVIKTGWKTIGFAIQAHDLETGSKSPDGIYSALLYLDDEPVSGFKLDSIDYIESRYTDAQIDYQFRYNGGSFLQQLSPLPGDYGPVYKKYTDDGLVHLIDTNRHAVMIDIKDAYGNTSLLNFNIQYADSLDKEIYPPISAVRFMPGIVNVLEKPGLEMYIERTALYDTVSPVYFRSEISTPYALSAKHQLNDASVPLHDDVIVRIIPDRIIPVEWQDKLVIQRTDRKGTSIRKASWQEKWLSAKFSDLGAFQLLADTMAPVLTELGKGDTIDLSPAKRILFIPYDNMGVIRKFRAELDGQWIRFTNDKSRSWIYIFDERCPFGVHELKITVEDLVGNTTTKQWWFKRYPYTPPKKKAVKKKSKKYGNTKRER